MCRCSGLRGFFGHDEHFVRIRVEPAMQSEAFRFAPLQRTVKSTGFILRSSRSVMFEIDESDVLARPEATAGSVCVTAAGQSGRCCTTPGLTVAA